MARSVYVSNGAAAKIVRGGATAAPRRLESRTTVDLRLQTSASEQGHPQGPNRRVGAPRCRQQRQHHGLSEDDAQETNDWSRPEQSARPALATAAAAASLCLMASTPFVADAAAGAFQQSTFHHSAASHQTNHRGGTGRVTAWLRTPSGQALEHFITGGIGGCVGAAAVFPIDLVKTRLQAQKGSSLSSHLSEDDDDEDGRMYTSGMHCFWTVLREEGPLGLYSGLSAQLIGVWPEKAVKLTANDFVRGMLANPVTGAIPLPGQIAAGAFGGLCQTVFTNPLEMVKIQLQLGGARRAAAPMSSQLVPALASMDDDLVLAQQLEQTPQLVQVVQDLGLAGLYRGVETCAARDMFFSAVYFPLFAHLKEVFGTYGHQGGLWLLLAGTLAGAPAAYFSTPLDMIKTRQQADVAPGSELQSASSCLKEILEEGGWQALFTGGAARVLRSAPQFGVTLYVYDQLNSAVQAFLN